MVKRMIKIVGMKKILAFGFMVLLFASPVLLGVGSNEGKGDYDKIEYDSTKESPNSEKLLDYKSDYTNAVQMEKTTSDDVTNEVIEKNGYTFQYTTAYSPNSNGMYQGIDGVGNGGDGSNGGNPQTEINDSNPQEPREDTKSDDNNPSELDDSDDPVPPLKGDGQPGNDPLIDAIPLLNLNPDLDNNIV